MAGNAGGLLGLPGPGRHILVVVNSFFDGVTAGASYPRTIHAGRLIFYPFCANAHVHIPGALVQFTMTITASQLNCPGELSGLSGMLNRAMTVETGNVALLDVYLVEPRDVPALYAPLNMALAASLISHLASAFHRLAVTLDAARTCFHEGLVGKSHFANLHILPLLPVADRAVLIVIGRGYKKVTEHADVLVHLHMRLALDQGIMAARAVQRLAPLHVFDVLKMIEGRLLEAHNLDGIGFVAQNTFFILHLRLQGKLIIARKITHG